MKDKNNNNKNNIIIILMVGKHSACSVYCTVSYFSTVQYSTVQYSTVHIRGGGVAPELTDYVLKLGL